MARKHNGVRELDFDEQVFEPLEEDEDMPPRSTEAKGYRWQSDPKRFDPQAVKVKKRK